MTLETLGTGRFQARRHAGAGGLVRRLLGALRRLSPEVAGARRAVDVHPASYRPYGGVPGAPSPAGACTVELRAGEVIRLTAESGLRELEVCNGTLWLTATPAKGDVLLESGERFALDADWPFVLQSLGGTKLVLRSRPAVAPVSSFECRRRAGQ